MTLDQAKAFWTVFRHGLLHRASLNQLDSKGRPLPFAYISGNTMFVSLQNGDFYVNPNHLAGQILKTIQSNFEKYEGSDLPQVIPAGAAGGSGATGATGAGATTATTEANPIVPSRSGSSRRRGSEAGSPPGSAHSSCAPRCRAGNTAHRPEGAVPRSSGPGERERPPPRSADSRRWRTPSPTIAILILQHAQLQPFGERPAPVVQPAQVRSLPGSAGRSKVARLGSP